MKRSAIDIIMAIACTGTCILFKKPSDFSRPSVSWFGVVVSVMSEVPIIRSTSRIIMVAAFISPVSEMCSIPYSQIVYSPCVKNTLKQAVKRSSIIMDLSPFTMNLNGTFDSFMTVIRNTVAIASAATPRKQNREVISVLHIAICDDEENEIEYLKHAVEDWARKEDILTNIERYASAESFLFEYEECKNYQILLLDVEMSGMTGIDLAKKIRQNQDNVEIIFITSHFEFIGEGYEVDALHYLVKPVKASKVEEVLSKAKQKIESGEPSIIIHYNGEIVKIYEKEILYLESLSHYITIYTKDKEYKIKANISTFAQELSEDFYQTHRSYLVSLKHIMRISRDSVILDNGGQVPLARGKYDQINRAYIDRN